MASPAFPPGRKAFRPSFRNGNRAGLLRKLPVMFLPAHVKLPQEAEGFQLGNLFYNRQLLVYDARLAVFGHEAMKLAASAALAELATEAVPADVKAQLAEAYPDDAKAGMFDGEDGKTVVGGYAADETFYTVIYFLPR